MQKTFNFFYAFLLAILGFGATLMAEDITLTTYYPAPYGVYDQLDVDTNLTNNPVATTTTALNIDVDESGTNSGTIRGLNVDVSGVGSGTVYAAIFQGGNVGIGITAPSYKLDIAGDINTTGDVRKNGSAYANPDYVFEPGYKLMNIIEVKNYVFENKHLPNMPSSEEIKTDGVRIFEQNRLLLEKLEEAYLHIFQLEERIAKLERR